MKQLLLIERKEIERLQKGHSLEVTVGGQTVLIGFEKNGHPRKAPTEVKCKKCPKLKPFSTQAEYMKHRREKHG